jgi:hypothetical protein
MPFGDGFVSDRTRDRTEEALLPGADDTVLLVERPPLACNMLSFPAGPAELVKKRLACDTNQVLKE